MRRLTRKIAARGLPEADLLALPPPDKSPKLLTSRAEQRLLLGLATVTFACLDLDQLGRGHWVAGRLMQIYARPELLA
jgi:hypothetical protein